MTHRLVSALLCALLGLLAAALEAAQAHELVRIRVLLLEHLHNSCMLTSHGTLLDEHVSATEPPAPASMSQGYPNEAADMPALLLDEVLFPTL